MKLRVFRLLAIAGLISRFLGSVQTLAQNAYITNDGSGDVSVIDMATNMVAATITVGTAPFAVARAAGKGEVSWHPPEGRRATLTRAGPTSCEFCGKDATGD